MEKKVWLISVHPKEKETKRSFFFEGEGWVNKLHDVSKYSCELVVFWLVDNSREHFGFIPEKLPDFSVKQLRKA